MTLFDSVVRHLRGPRCPITRSEREWIEEQFRWLRTELGEGPLRRDPLTPESPDLPRAWHGSYEDCEDLVVRLCRFMGIDPSTIEVRFFDDSDPIQELVRFGEFSQAGAAGLYRKGDYGSFILGIDEHGLADPNGLVATVCHELAHVLLLGQGRIAADRDDHEPLTDLLVIYFGAGVYSANTAFRFQQWQDSNMQGWSARRLGYLSEEALGYALALYTRERGERSPRWRRYLASNILHFVEETEYFLSREDPAAPDAGQYPEPRTPATSG